MSLYSFGFNGFQQTSNSDLQTILKSPKCSSNIKKVLFTSWETTVVQLDNDTLQIWGHQSSTLQQLISMTANEKLQIKSMFGDPNELMGMIDSKGKAIYVSEKSQKAVSLNRIVHSIVYCLGFLYILEADCSTAITGTTGKVYQVDRVNDEREDLVYTQLILPAVKSISGSKTHVLFLTESLHAPVYALGHNRLSQLGLDCQHQQEVVWSPTMIEYFCGLSSSNSSNAGNVACGPFHSAVILEGDVYTFGWSKEGRLGWGSGDRDDVVSLAVFLDVNNEPVEVNAVKVVCGSAHTLVLDDQGAVWSCGSDRYSQLGRVLPLNNVTHYDDYFRRCALFDNHTEKAIDCFTGSWNSFVSSKSI